MFVYFGGAFMQIFGRLHLPLHLLILIAVVVVDVVYVVVVYDVVVCYFAGLMIRRQRRWWLCEVSTSL